MEKVGEFVVHDTKFEGQQNSETALKLVESTVQVVNSTFVSNRRGSYHNMFYSYDGAIIATYSTVDIRQNKFVDNRADISGALFARQDSIIDMTGNVFIDNIATHYGGVLYSDSSSTITIEASEFVITVLPTMEVEYCVPTGVLSQ